jgi:DNA polymerase III subunit gamma/tau
MVRYLRNTLMAKLGGEQTELLQISADERARAARTALLFTEEELTRNLQIVLRTFDDLNYRQEQRFHLELGLLKLIHAQRLLPIEELLSGVAGGTGARTSAAQRRARTSAASQNRQLCLRFQQARRRENRVAGIGGPVASRSAGNENGADG